MSTHLQPALPPELVQQMEKVYQQVDEIEKILAPHPVIECPVTHRFTPGLYIREIFMPAGLICTSQIHRTRHPYVISKGQLLVFTPQEGTVRLNAPFTGITEPGTKRVLLIEEDTIWTTFHVTEKTDVAEIAKDILHPRQNNLLSAAEAAKVVDHTLHK